MRPKLILSLLFFKISVVLTHHLLRFNFCALPNVCTVVSSCQNSSLDFTVFGVKISSCGFDGTVPKVCCAPASLTTTSAPRVIRRDHDLVNHKNFDLLPLDGCGVISNRLRITSGASTSPGEFPWMALIAYKAGNSTQRDFKCGGTLITERHVLTAAHCIDNSTILGVRLGEYNLLTEIDCDGNGQNCEPPVQDFLIEKITVHPFYDSKTFVNDIALVKLAKPANFSYENVRPICLPFDELIDVRLEGEKLTVAGWGATESGEKSTILRQVAVPVVPTSSCQTQYAPIKPITKKQICAGGSNGHDSCAGDSGGPLKRVDLINDSPRYVQYGIVSFGPTRCGLSRRPGIYTNLQRYMKWLLDNLD